MRIGNKQVLFYTIITLLFFVMWTLEDISQETFLGKSFYILGFLSMLIIPVALLSPDNRSSAYIASGLGFAIWLLSHISSLIFNS